MYPTSYSFHHLPGYKYILALSYSSLILVCSSNVNLIVCISYGFLATTMSLKYLINNH